MTMQIEIQWCQVHPHPSWPDAKPDPVVWIDPAKFDALWRLGDQWVGPGGNPGGQGNRYPRAGKWILSGNPTDMCQIWISDEGVGFIDGRHRFAWLRDQGVLAIPVQLSPESLERGIDPFATVMRTSMLPMSTDQDDA